ncbi:HlyD family secretion protein [Pinisolibacter sp.]|uniref:HlyD family secretion protein n=1 Tax=Pinisolibacter sp. TaxID=2172024 RepID=UPI002FDEB33D
MPSVPRYVWLAAAVVALAIGGYLLRDRLAGDGYGDGFASGNGRIEAVEIDIAARSPGRIREILVDEGDRVSAGQILVRMDTDPLMAQRREAEAQLKRAEIGVETAEAQVAQRRAESQATLAVVEQRRAERDAADQKLGRTEQLVRTNSVSLQTLDDDRARALGMRAAFAAAEAQVAAGEAAIGAARSQVVNAEAAVEAAKATLARIDVELADSELRTPRDGRVQYRVAQPGEIVAGGGRILNVVDLGNVFMTVFLPTVQAGRIEVGSEVRIVLDAAPLYVIPAEVAFVADVAQFTPKTVETAKERQKLMFRIKARISPELLAAHIDQVKTGLPGVAHLRLDPKLPWPADLERGLLK